MSDMHLSAFWDGCVGRKSPSALYAEGHLFYSSSSELVEPTGLEPVSKHRDH
ncbi:MAG: hypothetical protein RI983_251 [Bacteroidota bacterium]